MIGRLLWSALLVVSLVAIALQLRIPSEPEPSHGVGFDPLVALPAAAVDAVEIRRGGRARRFVRDREGRWPTPQLEATLATFARARIERIVDASGQRATAYGLEPPDLWITLWSGERPLRFAAGDVAADTLSRYVMLPDGAIATIPDYQVRGWVAVLAAETNP